MKLVLLTAFGVGGATYPLLVGFSVMLITDILLGWNTKIRL